MEKSGINFKITLLNMFKEIRKGERLERELEIIKGNKL